MTSSESSLKVSKLVLLDSSKNLLSVWFMSFIFTQFTEIASVYAQPYANRGDILPSVLIASFGGIFEIVWGSIWIIAICDALRRITPNEFIGKTTAGFWQRFNQILIEQVRVMSAIIFRLPFLIVPALIEMVRLNWVGFITAVDPAYEKGHVNVLIKSRNLVRIKFWQAAIILIASVLLPFILQNLIVGQDKILWDNPIGVIFNTSISFIIHLWLTIVMLRLYLRTHTSQKLL